jgi:DNA-binding MarR family transcriptional regulator
MSDYPTVSVDSVMELHEELMRQIHFAPPNRLALWDDLTITLSQLRVLGLLASQPRGMSGRELATTLHIGPSAVTPLADRLVEQGYARREEDTVDRRITRLLVTSNGLALLEKLTSGKRENVRRTLEQLSPSELAVVARGLHLMSQAAQRAAGATESVPAGA